MNKLNFKWVTKTGCYQSGESLYLNKICVGGFNWNVSQSKSTGSDNSTNWEGQITLPSLADKSKMVYGSSPDEIKLKIERVVTDWFREALD